MPTLIYRLLYIIITDWLDMESEAGFSSGHSLSAPARLILPHFALNMAKLGHPLYLGVICNPFIKI